MTITAILVLFHALCANAFSVFPSITYPPKVSSSLLDASILPCPNDTGNYFSDPTVEVERGDQLAPWQVSFTKFNMMVYIASMCLLLPFNLAPLWALRQFNLIDKCQSEDWSLRVAQCCARNLLYIIPFVDVQVTSSEEENTKPEPSIWVANHVSPLDTFLFLATDRDLRGSHRRPIKTIYWKGLEENPVIKLVFSMAGFIPVQMADNGSGNPNEYDASSFKQLVRGAKQAFAEGFDIFLLPEGQLNPHPEEGLLPVFTGAYNLAAKNHRPIRLVGVYNTDRLWNANDEMVVTDNQVRLRSYPAGREFCNAQDFSETLHAILGYYGANGEDTPQLDRFLYD